MESLNLAAPSGESFKTFITVTGTCFGDEHLQDRGVAWTYDARGERVAVSGIAQLEVRLQAAAADVIVRHAETGCTQTPRITVSAMTPTGLVELDNYAQL